MSGESLHGRIMNLQCQNPPPISLSSGFTAQREAQAYREGHRDARHAAAELALEADVVIDELVSVVRKLISARNTHEDCLSFNIACDAFIEEASAVLNRATKGMK
jgi:hypothetical protein